jgi:hypothetical protein
MTVTFEQLWAIANQSATEMGEPPAEMFGSIGLFLDRPMKPFGYYCTPKNVKTFAHTGCDGVHYSVLEIPSRSLSESPVVMTVPANYDNPNPNIIVGENLHEFLCLGSKASYLALEELSYAEGNLTPLKTNNYADDLTKLQIALLAGLSYKLSLKSWLHLEERIAALQDKYADLLVIPDEEQDLETRSQQEIHGLEQSFDRLVQEVDLSAYRITYGSTGLSELVEVRASRSTYGSKSEKSTENQD